MKSTFAEGEFWSKKSTVSEGILEGSNTFIFSDFKLHNNEGSLTFNK